MHNYKIGDKVLSPKFPNDKLVVNGIRADEVEVKTKSGALTWLRPRDLEFVADSYQELQVHKLYILDKRFANSASNVVELVAIHGKYFCRVKSKDGIEWDVMQIRLSEIENV